MFPVLQYNGGVYIYAYIYIYKLNVKTETTILSLGFRVRDSTPIIQNQM